MQIKVTITMDMDVDGFWASDYHVFGNGMDVANKTSDFAATPYLAFDRAAIEAAKVIYQHATNEDFFNYTNNAD